MLEVRSPPLPGHTRFPSPSQNEKASALKERRGDSQVEEPTEGSQDVVCRRPQPLDPHPSSLPRKLAGFEIPILKGLLYNGDNGKHSRASVNSSPGWQEPAASARKCLLQKA